MQSNVYLFSRRSTGVQHEDLRSPEWRPSALSVWDAPNVGIRRGDDPPVANSIAEYGPSKFRKPFWLAGNA